MASRNCQSNLAECSSLACKLSSPWISSVKALAGITLLYALAFLCATQARGQATQTVIHEFSSKDGENPAGDLVADSSGNLYGTTAFGGKTSATFCVDNGSSGCGSIFELTPKSNNQWLRVELYRFTGGWSDGYRPLAGLVRDGAGNLYGTTAFGGHYGGGVVFELSPTSAGGWNETVLYHFGSSTNTAGGSVPLARLALDSSGNLYGTASQLGNITGACADTAGCGTVFKLSPTSSGLWTETVLYTFTGGTDGAVPVAGLALDTNGNLYGTASGGGASGCPQGLPGCGVVFELSPNLSGGWTETVLYTFSGLTDGSTPASNLIFDSSGNLYGTTSFGGSATGCRAGCGVVYKLSPNPSGAWNETVLRTFQPGTTGWGDSNGGEPEADVYLDGSGNLFGTTFAGGTTTACGNEGCGVVFELSPTSSGEWTETILHSFSGGSDGSKPLGGLVLGQAGNLFGTTYNGGNPLCTGGCGVAYQITP